MVLDIQTVHHILKNTAVQNVNKPFGVLYTLPYREYLMARVLTVFPFFYCFDGVCIQ